MPHIELIARAVICKSNKYLLAKQKTESNTFLPGGHIEPGEYAEEALKRELKEELGVYSYVGQFIGVLEHKYTDRQGNEHEELNLLFETSINSSNVKEVEQHLKFKWVKQDDFEKENLLPSSLQTILPNWFKKKTPFHSLQKD